MVFRPAPFFDMKRDDCSLFSPFLKCLLNYSMEVHSLVTNVHIHLFIFSDTAGVPGLEGILCDVEVNSTFHYSAVFYTFGSRVFLTLKALRPLCTILKF
jgi:hypothetical protein